MKSASFEVRDSVRTVPMQTIKNSADAKKTYAFSSTDHRVRLHAGTKGAVRLTDSSSRFVTQLEVADSVCEIFLLNMFWNFAIDAPCEKSWFAERSSDTSIA
jgi:hypothetical protein